MGIREFLAGIDADLGKLESRTATVTSNLDKVSTAAQRVVDEAGRAHSSVAELTDQAGSQLEDLYARFDKTVGPLNDAIKRAIEDVRIGALDVQSFISQFGSAVVVTENGSKTIRELLAGIDFRGVTDKIQKLIGDLNQGSATIGEAMAFLTERGGAWAEELRAIVAAVQSGTVKVEKLEAFVRQLKQLLGESDLTDLLDQLTDSIQDELLQDGP